MFNVKVPCSGVSPLTISYNDALAFSNGGPLSHFALVRTKLLFAAKYKRKDGSTATKMAKGEFIDVSISHADDSTLPAFFNMFDKPGEDALRGSTLGTHIFKISPKAFLDPESGEYYLNPEFFEREGWEHLSRPPVQEILAQSLYDLQHDLFHILFVQSIYPWHSAKYEKRVDRLMLLCFTQLLPMTKEGLDFMKEVLSWVSGQETQIKLETMPKYNDGKEIFYNTLLPEVADRVSKALASGDSKDILEAKIFVKYLKDNLQVLVKAAEKLVMGSFYHSDSMYLGQVHELERH